LFNLQNNNNCKIYLKPHKNMTPEFVRKHTIFKILRAPQRYHITTTTGYVRYEELVDALETEHQKHDGNPLYNGLIKNSFKNIKRDIKSIEYFFEKEIEFRRNKGFKIVNIADLTNDQQLIFDKMELFLSKDTEKKWQPYITAEASSLPNYIDIIEISHAIKNKYWITLSYNRRYEDKRINKETNVKIQPLHIKQSNRGWYLLGYNKTNGVYAYSLDKRIGRITISKEPIKEPYPFDKDTFFKNMFGIVNDCKPEKIVLKVANHHFKYLLDKPLPNQQIISNPKELNSTKLDYKNPDIWGEISFFAQPNHELLMELFKYNIWVKVVSPSWFAEKIASQYQFMLQQYYPQFMDDTRDYFIK